MIKWQLLKCKVRGDFVLVSGDTVSNMSLKEVLQEHKERRKLDKLAVMTMVLKRSTYINVCMSFLSLACRVRFMQSFS